MPDFCSQLSSAPSSGRGTMGSPTPELRPEHSSRFSGPSWLVGPSAGSAGLEEQPALPDEVWLVDEERHQPNL